MSATEMWQHIALIIIGGMAMIGLATWFGGF